MFDGLSSWFSFVADRWDTIVEATIDHARLTLTVVIIATVISLLVGIFVHQRPALRSAATTVAGIFLTIPSLALFAVFIPIVGIGNTPAIIAMVLYAILPILRNTVTGLDGVDPAVIESAKGMGMGSTRRLAQIKLPLAWPVIMAGIRVSSLLTVGIAAIAVLVGGDGLGEFIKAGITRLGLPNSNESVWVGVVFIVGLGLLLDLIFAIIQRLTTSRGLRP